MITSSSSNGWTPVSFRSSRIRSYCAIRSPSTSSTVAPYPRAASIFAGTAVVAITTVAGTPAFRAAQASAPAAFPAETVMTPRSRSSGLSRSSLVSRPRTLKLPVFWNSSALSTSSPPNRSSSAVEVSIGVRWIRPSSWSAAWRMSSSVGMAPTLFV